MSKVVIGIDPDSKAHGVAVYLDNELIELKCLMLPEFIGLLEGYNKDFDDIEIHIEDVCANSAAFQKSGIKNAKAATAINRSIGKCQQSQIELERFLTYYDVKVVKHKISKTWKKDKAQFELVTGWGGRSNEDTRSAAWFGYYGVK